MLSAIQYGESWGALHRESQSAVSEVNQPSIGLLFHLVIVLYLLRRVSDLSFSVDDLVTYAHLLSVSLNFQLSHGKLCAGSRAGEH